jgi:hypothetical protein
MPIDDATQRQTPEETPAIIALASGRHFANVPATA